VTIFYNCLKKLFVPYRHPHKYGLLINLFIGIFSFTFNFILFFGTLMLACGASQLGAKGFTKADRDARDRTPFARLFVRNFKDLGI